MHIIIRCNDLQKQELLTKPVNNDIRIEWYGEDDLIEEADADVYFDLLFDKEHTGANLFVKGRPVFANAVISTTKDFKYENYIRINAWPGFLDKPLLEIAAADSMELVAEEVLDKIGWTYTWA
ncbi:MAG: 3-hydroxyacyl-CoA dehydrogenase protein, partial [Chitinophagaceae bacterium]|nr:3-hydroxyacyl-CoA dehydrogenase protein [Chitinophagaceae bacterium]